MNNIDCVYTYATPDYSTIIFSEYSNTHLRSICVHKDMIIYHDN